MAIEIVDLPTNSMVIFHSYVSLPEGNVLSQPDILGISWRRPHQDYDWSHELAVDLEISWKFF